MIIIPTTEPLTNLQLEILKLYSTKLDESELNELKLLLARQYAQKAIEEVDEIKDTSCKLNIGGV